MYLLERETQLARLTEGYDHVLHGQGRLVLVHGEAGAGKTSLVEHFLGALPSAIFRLIAGCEPLFTPRPLGPLVDLAESFPASLTAAIREPGRSDTLFPDLLKYLRHLAKPTVLVIDDLHWADSGTLDLVRYLGRRLASTPLLLVVTYRDDGLTLDHPLRTLLGDLPATTTTRVAVSCLSAQAVGSLAQRAHYVDARLFEITGGNPFFVTEMLNCRDGAVPPSVYDATLCRFSHLTPKARALAEMVATSPKRIERSLVTPLIEGSDTLIDECVGKGLLRINAGWISFRHELARQAVELSLQPSRRMELNRKVFTALQARHEQSTVLSRLVQHAQQAELSAEILVLAPRAALAAAIASAHREAAEHYALALRYASELDPPVRAELLELAAEEYRLVSDVDATLAATTSALQLRTELGDALRQGMNLRRLALALREKGDRAAAENRITQAVATLETVTPSIDLVRAYAQQSLMRAWSAYGEAVGIGERAIALAETFDDAQCMVEALHACMSARMYLADDRDARAQLERALAIAIEGELEDAAAHLFVALQLAGVIHRDHDYAIEAANSGLAYCEARDLDTFVFRLLDNRALSLTELGRWPEADADLARCLAAPHIAERLRNSLSFLKARQDARRGVAGSDAYWSSLQDDPGAVPMGYRLPAVANACAEVAWLRGDQQAAQQMVKLGIETALSHTDGRLLGPLLVWARRCGVPVRYHALNIAPAHACELAGDYAGAAAHWQTHGCVYERALALLQGDEHQVSEALQQFDALGAKPAADIARRRLRVLGVRGVKRGPQLRTQADTLGLTAREREVYELLRQALSNAEIARRLHRSERTVEHHVSNVLAKLGFDSRSELLLRAG